MNLASALFKRILELKDFDTWASVRKHYLPPEYHRVYEALNKHIEIYSELPTIENLKMEIRDTDTLDKIYAIESVEVETEPFLLLDYLKNEFTQKEVLFGMQNYVDKSIAFETAEETIDSLYQIISDVEGKVDLEDPEVSMSSIELFDDDSIIDSYIPLGLNDEFDTEVRFAETDYIMLGGYRGSGKSATCSNIAQSVLEKGKSVLYFTIEMPPREIIQRQCSIATQVNHSNIKYKNLDNAEWEKVARWWAQRFENGDTHLEEYLKHRAFNKFHKELVKEELSEVQFDVIYDPNLTLAKFKAEAFKRVNKLKNVGLIIVDYVNQIKKHANSEDMYDWKEQIHVSKSMKSTAQVLKTPVVSPYQVDKSGEARLSKGILDSADAAFVLTAGPDYVHFECTKMRGGAMTSFTSATNWPCLTIGPENGVMVEEGEQEDEPGPIMDGIYEV